MHQRNTNWDASVEQMSNKKTFTRSVTKLVGFWRNTVLYLYGYLFLHNAKIFVDHFDKISVFVSRYKTLAKIKNGLLNFWHRMFSDYWKSRVVTYSSMLVWNKNRMYSLFFFSCIIGEKGIRVQSISGYRLTTDYWYHLYLNPQNNLLNLVSNSPMVMVPSLAG